jgi:hypothetical protein
VKQLLASSSLVPAPAPVPKPQRKPERPAAQAPAVVLTASTDDLVVFKMPQQVQQAARVRVRLVERVQPVQQPNADPLR